MDGREHLVIKSNEFFFFFFFFFFCQKNKFEKFCNLWQKKNKKQKQKQNKKTILTLTDFNDLVNLKAYLPQYICEISFDLHYRKYKKKSCAQIFPLKSKIAAVSMATDVGTHIFTHFKNCFTRGIL